MAVTVSIEAHVLSTRTGLWCDTCHLPSCAEVAAAIVASESLAILGRYTSTVCLRCGTEEITR